MTQQNGPAITIAVETENLKAAGRGRGRLMFDALRNELASFELPVEVLICHEAEEEGGELPIDPADGLEVRTVPVDPQVSAYYEMKNRAIEEARGDIVCLIDSDVIPEPGWLAALLRPLGDPTVDIVSGNTYVGPLDDFLTKCFALFWNFELRDETDEVSTSSTVIHVNNLAARTRVLCKYPFPTDDRLRSSDFAKRMLASETRCLRTSEARVAHPAPHGFMIRRALWRGHDFHLTDRKQGRSGGAARAFKIAASYFKDAIRRIAGGYRKVGLSMFGAIGAIGVAAFYSFWILAGYLVTRWSPGLIARRFAL